MIKLTKFNGQQFVVNCDLIEAIESTPDTVVSLTTDQRYVVRETVDEVIERVASFKQSCYPGWRFLQESAIQKVED
ncbi:MAG: flagellar FlbD family protein [bacterium]|jgi:flagellar protein FlbD|nr:flagellar FlbD family protein [bacterium]